MFDFLKQMMGMGPQVDLGELKARGAVIIDVRTPQEFQGGHAPGAINIPLDVLPGKLAKLDKSKPIITCCVSGNRSGMAANILTSNGFTEVVNGGPWQNLN